MPRTYCPDCEETLLPEEMGEDVCAICQDKRNEFLEAVSDAQAFEFEEQGRDFENVRFINSGGR